MTTTNETSSNPHQGGPEHDAVRGGGASTDRGGRDAGQPGPLATPGTGTTPVGEADSDGPDRKAGEGTAHPGAAG